MLKLLFFAVGFVSFTDKKCTEEAMRQRNGYVIIEYELYVQLEADPCSEKSRHGLSVRVIMFNMGVILLAVN